MINEKYALLNPSELKPQVRNLIATICYQDVGVIVSNKIKNRKRIAEKINKSNLEEAIYFHKHDPFMTHNLINNAIANIVEDSRVERYICAAVDLEILLDRLAFPECTVVQGIPNYIMDGYTDMGQFSSNNNRHGREKFRVEKDNLKMDIKYARSCAIRFLKREINSKFNLFFVSLNILKSPVKYLTKSDRYSLIEQISNYIITNMSYNRDKVYAMAERYDEISVPLDIFREEGYGICRHHAVMAQILFQVSGLISKLEKGNHYSGRHVWNHVYNPDCIVDTTLKCYDLNSNVTIRSSDVRPDYFEKSKDGLSNYKIVHN